MSLESGVLPNNRMKPHGATNTSRPYAPQGKTMAMPATVRSMLNTPTLEMDDPRSMGNTLWPANTQNEPEHGNEQKITAFQLTNIKPEPYPQVNQIQIEPSNTNETVVTFEIEDAPVLFEDVIMEECASPVQWVTTTTVEAAPIAAEPIPVVAPGMVAVNPCHVEGVEFDLSDVVAEPVAKKNKKNLKLIMPESATEPIDSSMDDVLDTPALENVLCQEAQESNFDLLDFVVNAELPVNDPEFVNLIGGEPSGSAAAMPDLLSTIDTSELFPEQLPQVEMEPVASTSTAAVPQGKRLMGKGKKGKAAPAKRRGRPPTATVTSDHSYLPETEDSAAAPVEEKKYRRMRDLNNIASKRCRQNRKRKFQTLQEQEDELTDRNAELRARCGQLEDVVKRLKEQFIQKVANPQRQPLDLDALMSQRLSAMGSV